MNEMAHRVSPLVIAIVGPSGSGKTSLIERLVPHLKERGLKVATIKHAHDGYDLDRPGKDSWRHLKAGAEAVAVVGPTQLMLVEPILAGDGLTEALGHLPRGLDLILLEGFRQKQYPQILVTDRADQTSLEERVIAVVSNHPGRGPVPQFRWDEIRDLAAFIEHEWVKPRKTSFQGSSSVVA